MNYSRAESRVGQSTTQGLFLELTELKNIIFNPLDQSCQRSSYDEIN